MWLIGPSRCTARISAGWSDGHWAVDNLSRRSSRGDGGFFIGFGALAIRAEVHGTR